MQLDMKRNLPGQVDEAYKSGFLPDGIHLNVPHEQYLADPALGFVESALRQLAITRRYWLNSALNPHYVPDGSTKAQAVGTAFHTMALEGPKAFHDRFVLEPGPEYMRTVAEISDFVRSRGGKPSKLKVQVIEDALALDPAAKIYDVAVAAATDAGKQILKEEATTFASSGHPRPSWPTPRWPPPSRATAFTDFRESVESLSYIVCIDPYFRDSV